MGIANLNITPKAKCSKKGCCTIPLWCHLTIMTTFDKDTCDLAREAVENGFNENKKDGDHVSPRQTIVKCDGSVKLVLVKLVDSKGHPTDKMAPPISITTALGLLTKSK